MEFRIKTAHEARSTSIYRTGDAETWELEEATRRAAELLNRPGMVNVSVGNSEHEFRLWAPGVEAPVNFRMGARETPRWSDWFVDVEIDGRRWVYRPLADLRDHREAAELHQRLDDLDVDDSLMGRVWVGASDGGEEYEYGGDQD